MAATGHRHHGEWSVTHGAREWPGDAHSHSLAAASAGRFSGRGQTLEAVKHAPFPTGDLS